MTLCIIQDGGRVLLGMKKRGFGVGRWNGFGGKVEGSETPFDAALREVQEEIGVSVQDAKKRGKLEFFFEKTGEEIEVHVYGASRYEGEPKEGEEMAPQWFLHADIPFDKMWPDDKHWFPLFLAGKNFEGKFYFTDYDTFVKHELYEI
ncbi:MAG: 8-oxo-dGTP diphosphatase [bacterium]|nr:8-oxo-dGTP diphosphatase [bacterium]